MCKQAVPTEAEAEIDCPVSGRDWKEKGLHFLSILYRSGLFIPFLNLSLQVIVFLSDSQFGPLTLVSLGVIKSSHFDWAKGAGGSPTPLLARRARQVNEHDQDPHQCRHHRAH
jgi:hypothetical protein